MTEPTEPAIPPSSAVPPTTPPPPPSPTGSAPDGPNVARPGRVRPRRVIAIVVAAVMLAGIGGLVAAALLGDDDSPSSDRLQQPLDLDGPAVATNTDDSATAPDTAASAAAPPPPMSPSNAGGAGGDEPAADDGVAPVASIVSPTDDADLPPLASAPIELPELVPPPPVASVVAALPLGELTVDSIDVLAGWSVVDRQDGYVAFSDGTVVVEVFTVADPSATDAGTVLTTFLADQLSDAERLTVSDTAAQGAARSEFVSVAGAEYVAVTAGQQGTRTMSGAAVAAVGPGSAVVVTSSREGRASTVDLAGDAELLQAVLAHVDTA